MHVNVMKLFFQKKCKIKFCVLGLKCIECGSYNTSREGEEGVPVVPRPAIFNPVLIVVKRDIPSVRSYTPSEAALDR